MTEEQLQKGLDIVEEHKKLTRYVENLTKLLKERTEINSLYLVIKNKNWGVEAIPQSSEFAVIFVEQQILWAKSRIKQLEDNFKNL